MSLYLGSDKVKINLGGIAYRVSFFSAVPDLNGERLLSSDDYILKDSTGIYLLPSNVFIDGGVSLLTSDGCTLLDVNKLYLTAKGG